VTLLTPVAEIAPLKKPRINNSNKYSVHRILARIKECCVIRATFVCCKLIGNRAASLILDYTSRYRTRQAASFLLANPSSIIDIDSPSERELEKLESMIFAWHKGVTQFSGAE
jgi:hypothetical protein